MASQYEINIIVGDKGTGDDTVTGTGGDIAGMSQVGTTQEGTTKTTEFDKGASQLGKYVSSQTLQVFINETKSAISSQIGLITGRSELQQRINFGMNSAQQIAGVYKNAVAGGLITSSMGMSSGVGKAIGVALSVLSFGINTLFRANELNTKQTLENYQVQQTRTRAGAMFNRSREGS